MAGRRGADSLAFLPVLAPISDIEGFVVNSHKLRRIFQLTGVPAQAKHTATLVSGRFTKPVKPLTRQVN